MAPRHATAEIQLALRSFKKGTLSGVSERGIKDPDWLAGSENVYGRPYRGLRVRPGSRDLSVGTLSEEPHSLMAYYSSGGNQVFVGVGNAIREVRTASFPLQTLPATHPANSDIFTHTNLDGILIATQRGGSLTPLMYDGAWKELKLPAPSAALTYGANTGGGSVDAGTHYYRIRWSYAKGSSLAGPGAAAPVVIAGTQTVHIATNLVPASPRSDWVGWILERTKVNGTANGPWWFVADGNSATYTDAKSDAQLGYMADDGLHGEPPHFDGVTGFAGLLWGWSGSKLYASRDIGELEATGIANFDADDIFQVSKDDGDSIQVCLVVIDELLILKKRSVHIIAGVDRDSFTLTSVVYADPARGSEAGCGGPRAACVIGGVAYFWGESGGLFTYSKGSVKPAGWVETGRYLDELNTAELDKLLLLNHQGNYMIAWYPRGASAIASEQVVLDARFKQWWHWKGWAARDAIELKSGLFGGASMIFADPSNHAAFGAIASGAVISGPGIQGSTTVVGAVIAGSTSLVMSKTATATAQNVALTIAGTVVGRCNTVSGSATVTITEYHVWAGFDGFRDEKQVSGATAVQAQIPVGPMIAFAARLNGQNTQIYAQAESLSGSALGPAGGSLVSVNGVANAVQPLVVPDGVGGIIVVWNDNRAGNTDIYAQRIDGTGVALWASGGVAICTVAGAQANPRIVSDGAGGAIICWDDLRGANRDIYAQRINASGVVQWTADGVVICNAASDQTNPAMCADASGGAIIAWRDLRSGVTSEIFAQRINAAGAVQWAANGVAITSVAGDQANVEMCSDGSGGAIMAWTDPRATPADVYAQRVDSLGAVQWAANGVVVANSAAEKEDFPLLLADGMGGAFVTYRRLIATINHLYLNRLSSAGALLFGAPLQITGAGGYAIRAGAPTMCTDAAGGVLLIYSSAGTQAFAQRIDGAGAIQWAAGGVAIGPTASTVQANGFAPDGLGGAFCYWFQRDNATGNYDLMAQRVDPNGLLMWGSGGVFVKVAANTGGILDMYLSTVAVFAESFVGPAALPSRGPLDVHFALESPWLDGGMPDDWKDMDRITYSADGDATPISITIETDPTGSSSAVVLTSTGQGADWAEDAASHPNDLVWDVGNWAINAPTTVAAGIAAGTLGRRFKITASGDAGGEHRPTGIEMVAVLLPDREYDR